MQVSQQRFKGYKYDLLWSFFWDSIIEENLWILKTMSQKTFKYCYWSSLCNCREGYWQEPLNPVSNSSGDLWWIIDPPHCHKPRPIVVLEGWLQYIQSSHNGSCVRVQVTVSCPTLSNLTGWILSAVRLTRLCLSNKELYQAAHNAQNSHMDWIHAWTNITQEL